MYADEGNEDICMCERRRRQKIRKERLRCPVPAPRNTRRLDSVRSFARFYHPCGFHAAPIRTRKVPL